MLDSMRRDWPSYARRSAQALCRRTSNETAIDWLSRMFSSARPQVSQEMWTDISCLDVMPLCSDLPVPALVVHGAQDEFAPVAGATAAAAACVNAELAIAQDCGHLVMLDQPAWFHNTLLTHLRSIHARP
jgi:pimeloyl-ACP methyl ester carboxylesterase